MNGIHLTADLADCTCPFALLTDRAVLAPVCAQAVAKSELIAVNEVWHEFPAIHGHGGVTGVILLAESHLAIHTWPEVAGATLDIYVCNFSEDNTQKARKLLSLMLEILKPNSFEIGQHTRKNPGLASTARG